jgi:ankyrin repeat protein
VKERVRKDYLRIASDMNNGEIIRAHSAFGYALRLLFTLNEDPDIDEGLRWLKYAAEHGILEAQAIVYRLHSAFQAPLIDDCPTKGWLFAAAKAGSSIALADLEQVDSALHAEVIQTRKQLAWVSNFDSMSHILMEHDSFLSRSEFVAMMQTTSDQIPAQLKVLVPGLLSQGYLQSIDDKLPDDGVPLGQALIHIAASIGDPAWVEALLELGADINRQTSIRGETPICCACQLGNTSMVPYLIDKGADLTIPDLSGATFLHYIAFLPDDIAESVARKLVTMEMNVNQVARPNRQKTFLCEDFMYHGTPLHWAVKLQRPRLIAVLLQLGADPLKSDGIEDYYEHPNFAHLAHKSWFQGYNSTLSSPLNFAIEDHQPDIVYQIIKHMESSGKSIDLQRFVKSALATVKLRMMWVNLQFLTRV